MKAKIRLFTNSDASKAVKWMLTFLIFSYRALEYKAILSKSSLSPKGLISIKKNNVSTNVSLPTENYFDGRKRRLSFLILFCCSVGYYNCLLFFIIIYNLLSINLPNKRKNSYNYHICIKGQNKPNYYIFTLLQITAPFILVSAVFIKQSSCYLESKLTVTAINIRDHQH